MQKILEVVPREEIENFNDIGKLDYEKRKYHIVCAESERSGDPTLFIETFCDSDVEYHFYRGDHPGSKHSGDKLTLIRFSNTKVFSDFIENNKENFCKECRENFFDEYCEWGRRVGRNR
jgi:hypothetical protein